MKRDEFVAVRSALEPSIFAFCRLVFNGLVVDTHTT